MIIECLLPAEFSEVSFGLVRMALLLVAVDTRPEEAVVFIAIIKFNLIILIPKSFLHQHYLPPVIWQT